MRDKTAASKLRSLVTLQDTVRNGIRNWRMLLNGRDIGGAHGRILPNGVQLGGVRIDKTLQGLGLGKKLYGDIYKSLQPGQQLYSDALVSGPATSLWQRLAKRLPVVTQPAIPQPGNPGGLMIADDAYAQAAKPPGGNKPHVFSVTKDAAPRWVKMLRGGQLSPGAVGKIAPTMPLGSFRTVGNLGRGQMNVADKVVGHMPVNTGSLPQPAYAGTMVRKLPTQALPSIQQEFQPVVAATNQLNQQYGGQGLLSRVLRRPPQAPPITPYVNIGERGAFQQLAGARTAPVPKQLMTDVRDLHPGNTVRDPRNNITEIFDFAGAGSSKSPMSSLSSQMARDPIDPATIPSIGIHNPLGNVNVSGYANPHTRDELRSLLSGQNDLVRRYWAMAPDARQTLRDNLVATAPARRQAIARNPRLPSDITYQAKFPPRKILPASVAETVPMTPADATVPNPTMPNWARYGIPAGAGLGAGAAGLYWANR